MAQHDDAISVQQMLDHAREATELIQGLTRESFDYDRVLQLATTRLLEIVGEAAARVSPVGREQYPQVPWRAVTGMRNRLIHGYDVVDIGVLWDTLTVDLPALIDVLNASPDQQH